MVTKVEDEQGAPPKRVLAKGDFRFVCVACQADAITKAAGTYAIANRLVGAVGWRVFLRDERGGATGLHCAKCSEGREAAAALPSDPAAAEAA